jgi:hypothetical protein
LISWLTSYFGFSFTPGLFQESFKEEKNEECTEEESGAAEDYIPINRCPEFIGRNLRLR